MAETAIATGGIALCRGRILALLSALVATAALAASAPPAEAKNKLIEIPATMQWFLGNGSPFQCYSIGMASWPEQEDAIGWVVHYKWNGDPRTRTISPPFSDEDLDRDPYNATPGEGRHWDLLTQGYRSHANPDKPPPDCSEIQSKQKAALSDVRIEITQADPTRIAGKVRDVDGDPVEGVEVRAKGTRGGTDLTNASGSYEIKVPGVERVYVVEPKKDEAKFEPRKRTVISTPGQTERVNFEMKGRVISGEVRLGCSGAGACSILPIAGVKVAAKRLGKGKSRTYRTETDKSGQYTMVVKRGRYKVETKNSVLKAKPKKVNVNLQSKGNENADFKPCRVDTEPSAPPGNPASNWATSFECDDIVQIAYNPLGQRDIYFRWISIPTCSSSEGPYLTNRRFYAFGAANGKGKEAFQLMNADDHIIDERPDKIRFVYPGSGAEPFQFFGELPASGKGSVSGLVTRTFNGTDCSFTLDAANIYRQGG